MKLRPNSNVSKSTMDETATGPIQTPINLTVAQQQQLLQLARNAIAAYLRERIVPPYETDDPALRRCAGLFVTLWHIPPLAPLQLTSSTLPPFPNELRGCIGHIWADTPLYQLVPEIAVAAATRDSRLPSVTFDELDELVIEISILSPLRQVTDPHQIQIGRHGLMSVYGIQRGLLLPQVPVEHGWDRAKFIRAVCLKAGLPQDAWPGQVKLYSFTTLKFGEKTVE